MKYVRIIRPLSPNKLTFSIKLKIYFIVLWKTSSSTA